MKVTKRFAVFYTLFVFLLGAVCAFFYSVKQQMDAVIQPESIRQTNNEHIQTQKNNDLINVERTHPQTQAVLEGYENTVNSNKLNNNNQKPVSLNDFSAKEAKSILDSMPDMVLSQYVDKFMAKGSSDVITDKRKFAERAVEELYKPNDSVPLSGDIKLSFNSTPPKQSMDTSVVSKNAKIYAHLNTYGKTPSSPHVFVKWVDNSTGQILLFQKKDVLASRQTNWVNFKPDAGWHKGTYDIKFYQFTSALEPIAQLTYSIEEVIE